MIKFDSPIWCAAAELRKSSNCKTNIFKLQARSKEM